MTRAGTPPKAGIKAGGKSVSPAGKANAGSCHKAVARLNHEVRHERPMTDWGSKGGKR
jgi:hypothetical protein